MCPVLLYSCLAVSSPYHQLISAFHSCTSQSLTPGVNQAGLFHWHMTKKNQLPREKRQKQRSSFLALGLRVTIFSEAGSTIIRWIAHLHCPPESVGSVFFSLDFVLRKILPLAARRPLEAPSAAHCLFDINPGKRGSDQELGGSEEPMELTLLVPPPTREGDGSE